MNFAARGFCEWLCDAAGSGIARQQQPEGDNPRSMLLMCYQNHEPPVKVPKGALQGDSPVAAAFSAAKKAGVEFWQVRLHSHHLCAQLRAHGCMIVRYSHHTIPESLATFRGRWAFPRTDIITAVKQPYLWRKHDHARVLGPCILYCGHQGQGACQDWRVQEGVEYWQPSHGARLQMHLASRQEFFVMIVAFSSAL